MGQKTRQDEHSSKEAQARFEAALRGANTPHKPPKDKPKVKKKKTVKKNFSLNF